MARKRNPVPSLRKTLNVRVRMPVADPRVQRAVDWLLEMNGKRKAAPMAWALLVQALNGELGAGVQEAVQAGARSNEEALQALDDAMEQWLA